MLVTIDYEGRFFHEAQVLAPDNFFFHEISTL